MRAYERLLKYAQYDTASDETSPTCPSTDKQLILGQDLVNEMKAIGMQDVRIDENGYVYGYVPATVEGRPTIGLIAHMDTVNCVPVLPMNPRIVENYDGGIITLDNGDPLDPAVYPSLTVAKGKSLIVTDGRTLLGADDKAGIAEIMTACERLIADPGLKHGKIAVAFTPDEEIGRGADRFDIEGFGADFAYTVDGDVVGGIEYDCFNAASMCVTVHGRNVHPGSAKNIMRNASLVAMEFNGMLPPAEIPACTEGYEGFYHLCHMSGDEELATLQYIIRDHDSAKFDARKSYAVRVTEFMNAKYGEGCVDTEIRDSYRNMREVIEKRPEIIRLAEAAYRKLGVEPFSRPIRGGTDGATLSLRGLPCPNLSTGGMNFHGRFECIPIEDMDTMSDMLVTLVTLDPSTI